MIKYLDFSDVLLMPESLSRIDSRKDVKIEVDGVVPISAANMETIGTLSTASHLSTHRWRTYVSKKVLPGDWQRFFLNTKEEEAVLAIPTFGIRDEDIKAAEEHWSARTRAYGIRDKYFCFDVANGHTEAAIAAVGMFIKTYPVEHLIFGNIGNPSIIKFLASHFRSVGGNSLKTISIKVGIGSGSVCTTRTMTGVGVPQFTLVQKCRKVADSMNNVSGAQVRIISDGGCRTPGDILKAYVAGAHEVMIGGMLAGTYETGEVFYGSSSDKASTYDPNKTYCTPEGKCVTIRRSKSIHDVVSEVQGGLRSGLSYLSCAHLEDLISRPTDYHCLIIEVNKQVDNYNDR